MSDTSPRTLGDKLLASAAGPSPSQPQFLHMKYPHANRRKVIGHPNTRRVFKDKWIPREMSYFPNIYEEERRGSERSKARDT
mmetsp:Transcript_8216/g.12477  ORF Transcript_8216/g.12477 Transcript_8216/m.12477 type:complete len:82 (-) Transcript_8216:315-560(-)